MFCWQRNITWKILDFPETTHGTPGISWRLSSQHVLPSLPLLVGGTCQFGPSLVVGDAAQERDRLLMDRLRDCCTEIEGAGLHQRKVGASLSLPHIRLMPLRLAPLRVASLNSAWFRLSRISGCSARHPFHTTTNCFKVARCFSW